MPLPRVGKSKNGFGKPRPAMHAPRPAGAAGLESRVEQLTGSDVLPHWQEK